MASHDPPKSSVPPGRPTGGAAPGRVSHGSGGDLLNTRRAVNRRTAAVADAVRRTPDRGDAAGAVDAAADEETPDRTPGSPATSPAKFVGGPISRGDLGGVIDPRTGLEADELVTSEEVDDELTLAELDSRFIAPPSPSVRLRGRGRMVNREEYSRLSLSFNENRTTVIRRVAAARLAPRVMQWFLAEDDNDGVGQWETFEELADLIWTTYRLLDPRRRSDRYSQISLGRLMPNTLAAASLVQFEPPGGPSVRPAGPQAYSRWAAANYADAGWGPVPTFWQTANGSDWRPLIDQLGWADPTPVAAAPPSSSTTGSGSRGAQAAEMLDELDASEVEVIEAVSVTTTPVGLDLTLPEFNASPARSRRSGRAPRRRHAGQHPWHNRAALEEFRRADSIHTLADWLRDWRIVSAIATSVALMALGMWLGGRGGAIDPVATADTAQAADPPPGSLPRGATASAAGPAEQNEPEPEPDEPAAPMLESWLRGVLTKIKRPASEEPSRPDEETVLGTEMDPPDAGDPPGESDPVIPEPEFDGGISTTPNAVTDSNTPPGMNPPPIDDAPEAAIEPSGEPDMAVVEEIGLADTVPEDSEDPVPVDELEAAIDRFLVEYSFPIRIWDLDTALKMRSTAMTVRDDTTRQRLLRFAAAHLALRTAWLTEDCWTMVGLSQTVARRWPVTFDGRDASEGENRWRAVLVHSWLKCQENVQAPEDIAKLAAAVIPMIDQAMLGTAMTKFSPVVEQLESLLPLLPTATVNGTNDVGREAEQIVDAYRRVMAADLSGLEDEAGAIFGRTECLLRRRWQTGLAALAQSSDATLASIAGAELKFRQTHGWTSIAAMPAAAAEELGQIGIRYARRANSLGSRTDGFNAMDREAASLRAHAIDLLRQSGRQDEIAEIGERLPGYLRWVIGSSTPPAG